MTDINPQWITLAPGISDAQAWARSLLIEMNDKKITGENEVRAFVQQRILDERRKGEGNASHE